MSRGIRRAARVRQDLVDIYTYIHGRSPGAAEKVLHSIEANIRSLSDSPGIGRYWASSDPRFQGVRIAVVRPYRNYLIFFRLVDDTVEIYRVVHGARELEPLMDDLDPELDEL